MVLYGANHIYSYSIDGKKNLAEDAKEILKEHCITEAIYDTRYR